MKAFAARLDRKYSKADIRSRRTCIRSKAFVIASDIKVFASANNHIGFGVKETRHKFINTNDESFVLLLPKTLAMNKRKHLNTCLTLYYNQMKYLQTCHFFIFFIQILHWNFYNVYSRFGSAKMRNSNTLFNTERNARELIYKQNSHIVLFVSFLA